MVLTVARQLSRGTLPVVLLFSLLLVSFYLLSNATENSARFANLYGWLLLINVAGLLVLVGMISINLYRLLRQYRSGVAGSRLTLRMVVMFVVLSVLPVTVVYYFSLQFIQRSVDSWFDVRIEKALDDALELSQAALDLRKRELLKQTQEMADELADVSEAHAAITLGDMRTQSEATEITLLGKHSRIIAFSSADETMVLPHRLSLDAQLQVRRGGVYVGLEPIKESGIHVRVAIPVPITQPNAEQRYLQTLFPIDHRLNTLADSVQNYFGLYKKLAYLRQPLKYSFTLTLSLVLTLSLFSAIWAAFFSARQLMAPVRDLAEGTRAVAAGDYNKQLPQSSHDELGFLVNSFNDMTRRIAQASDEARRSQIQVEDQRAYLEAVLGHLSSGVITLDHALILRTVNAAAGQILKVNFSDYIGHPLEAIYVENHHLLRFVDGIFPYLTRANPEWREEIILFNSGGRQVLMCRGTTLKDEAGKRGDHVIVFDDITALVQAQRDAAWGEVARRLAHEIKNPLTPIQLSAERLRHKYLHKMEAADAKVLDRSTHTIVQQVEVMKEMVNAFSEYARAPQLQLAPLDLNEVIRDVMELYQNEQNQLEIVLSLDPSLAKVEADFGRLRQLLHNLVKNAIEAMDKQSTRKIEISTKSEDDSDSRVVELRVKDDGPGFNEDMAGQYFEPYITTKPKGSGLGLAIVKKIVEEHGGVVSAENAKSGGACVVIRLPIMTGEKARVLNAKPQLGNTDE